MDKFAKLFDTDIYGQILVVIDEGDEGPEVRFSFTPAGLGVCSQAIKYSQESEDGWNNAQNFFDSIDETIAIESIKPTIDLISQSMN